tara:strand:- start:3387 stop:3998 length:612 start_codon:yes stop_codon:yes gene_type:complete
MKSISGEVRRYLKDISQKYNENICIFAQDNLLNFDQKALNNFLNIEDNIRLKKEERYSNKYFANDLSLLNNIDYIANLNSIDVSEFIILHDLGNIFNENKNYKVKEIHSSIVNKISFFLYLYTTKISLINKNLTSIMNVLSEDDLKILDRYFDDNQIFYFSVSKNCLKIRNMFSHFLLKEKNGNNFLYFNDPEAFKKNLKDNF